MAKLPIYTQQYGVSTRRADADDFGAMEGRALQNLGSGLGDLGLKLQAKKEQDNLSKARRDASDLELRLYEELARMRQSIEEGGEGHTEESREYIEAEWNNLISQYSGPAQEYLMESRGRSMLSHIPQEIEFEATARTTDLLSKEKDIGDRELNLVYVDPSALPATLERMRERMSSYGVDKRTGHGIPQEQLEELIRKQERELQVNSALGELDRATTVDEVNAIKDRLKGLVPSEGPGAIEETVDAIIGVESNGQADAQNPRSTARGTGQFIDSTWREMIRNYRPDLIEGRTDKEILALRDNPYISRQMVRAYAQENSKLLEKANLPITSVNLYALHHFGPKGIRVLKAKSTTAISSILSKTEMDANPYLKGKTVGQVLDNHAKRLAHYGGGEVDEAGNYNPGDFLKLFNQADARIREIERDNATSAAAQVSRITASYNDYTGYLKDGNMPDRPDVLSDSMIRQAYGTTGDQDDIDAGEDLIRDIKRYEKGAKWTSIMVKGSPEEVAEASLELEAMMAEGGSFDHMDKKAVQKMVADASAARVKGLEDAPADYVLKHSDKVKDKYQAMIDAEDDADRQMAMTDYFDTMVAEQERMGVPPSRIQVLTDGMIDQYKEAFMNDIAEGKSIYDNLQTMRVQTGRHFPEALRDLYDAKAAPLGLSVIAEISNPALAKEVGEALATRKSRIANFNLTETDYSSTDLLTNYALSLGGLPGAQRDLADMKAAVEALGIAYITSGRGAVKDAYEAIVEGQYEFETDLNIRVPRSETINVEYLDNAIAAINSQFDETYGDLIDWSIFSDQWSEEERRMVVTQSVTHGTNRYMTDPENKGLMILSDTGAPLLMKGGDPLIIAWSEIRQEARPSLSEIKGP